jgi:hypothetical protein
MFKKNKKIIILILTFLGVVILILVSLLYLPLINIDKYLISSLNNGTEAIENKDKIADYKNGYNFEKFSKEFYKEYKFVYTNYNPIELTITFVASNNCCDKNNDITVYHLKRKSITEFEIYSFAKVFIKNKTFQEAAELAQKYDLAQTNPDPANITVNPKPTQKEIDDAKEANKWLNNEEYLKAGQECVNNPDLIAKNLVQRCIYDLDKKFGKPLDPFLKQRYEGQSSSSSTN